MSKPTPEARTDKPMSKTSRARAGAHVSEDTLDVYEGARLLCQTWNLDTRNRIIAALNHECAATLCRYCSRPQADHRDGIACGGVMSSAFMPMVAATPEQVKALALAFREATIHKSRTTPLQEAGWKTLKELGYE